MSVVIAIVQQTSKVNCVHSLAQLGRRSRQATLCEILSRPTAIGRENGCMYSYLLTCSKMSYERNNPEV